jgi:hypothetical protein
VRHEDWRAEKPATATLKDYRKEVENALEIEIARG